MRSSGARISPARCAPLLTTTPLPSVARTTSRAPAIQLRLLLPASPGASVCASSRRVTPRRTSSKQTPARERDEIKPRLSGKGRRGDVEGSRVTRVGEKAEGGESERATCVNEVSEVGVTARRVVCGGYSGAVELACEAMRERQKLVCGWMCCFESEGAWTSRARREREDGGSGRRTKPYQPFCPAPLTASSP